MKDFRTSSMGLDFGFIDPDLSFLYEQMYENPGLERCIDLFEIYFLPKIKYESGPFLHRQLLQIINKYEFLINPKVLSDELNMDSWKLSRKMNKEIGFSAEQFIQIYKFCKTAEFFNRNPKASIFDAVAEFGFTDRAHLGRKFKMMSGFTPGKYKELSLRDNWKDLISPDYSGLILNVLEDME